MNRKRQEIPPIPLDDIQTRQRVSVGGSLNLLCAQELAFEVVSTEDQDSRVIEATRLAFRQRHKVTFNELMAIPVLFSSSGDADIQSDPELQPDLAHWDVVRDALRNWAPDGVRFNILRRLPSAAQLEQWKPETTRFLLEHALPGGTSFQHELLLPTHPASNRPASRLRFILVLASNERGWPRRYLIHQREGERLRTILKFVLEASGACVTQLGEVLPASEAITQGVCNWLELEIELSGYDTWSLHLDRDDSDRKWIHLARAGEPSSLLRVPLRSHLIGSTGLSKIVSHIGPLVARHLEVLQ